MPSHLTPSIFDAAPALHTPHLRPISPPQGPGEQGQDPPPFATGESGPQAPAGTQQPGDPNAPGQKEGADPGCMNQVLLIGGMVVIFYFLLMRPQQQQEKKRKALLSALKKGDSVVTNSGMHGKIERIDEETVVLLVDDGMRLKFDRSAIGRTASTGDKSSDTPPAIAGGSSTSDDKTS